MFFSRRRVAETSQEAADTPCYLRTHQVTVTVDLPDGGSQRILDSVTVRLEAPRTAVLGLNGSGKSTFLGLFNGLVHPAEGTVEVNGVDALAHPHKARQQVGMIFSDPATQLIMPTVREDIELSLRRNPASTYSTARLTTMPAAMPIDLESTTSTGKSSISSATMCAVWLVAESALAIVTMTAFV